MKKLILALFTICSISLQAQMPKNIVLKPGKISGKVIEAQANLALPYVNIIVKDINNKIITGGITDDNGLFMVKDIPEGKNTIEIQFIGFETYTKIITISNKNNTVDLGTISLTESSAVLDEVVIRSEVSSVVQKVDRKVINVGKDLTSSGTTASELLNNVQSVSVDSQTGAISLRGNENVRVLVDGKPTNIPAAQLLKQIPSNSIKSVELITNPSAKYNPEGMSGIINIILNKNANMGFNGSIDSGVEAGHYVRYNTSTNMNYKTGKVNFFGNYGYNGGERYNFGYVSRPGVNLQNFIIGNDNQSHLFKIGADIYVDKKNTLSFFTTQNWFNSDANASVKIRTNSGSLISDATSIMLQKNHTQTYNGNWKTEFEKEGHHLEIEANYSATTIPEDATNSDVVNPNNGELNFFNTIKNNRDNTLINLDYTNPISETTKLEMGLEYRADFTDNVNITNQLGNPSSSFDYDRKIYSAYFNYGKSFEKLTMQLGARLEQFEIEGNFNQEGQASAKVTDEIFSIYPSAFFTYAASDKNQFQVSYSRRVDRPSINQLNPIREFSTPLITSIGNEALAPQFTNSFEVNYTRKIKKGSVTLGTFYRQINDNISRVVYADPLDPTDRRQILSFTNFDDTSAYGVEFSINYKVAKWWRINSSMDFYSQKQFGIVDQNVGTRREVTNEVFNARVNNSFKVSKNLSLQLFAMYRGPQEDIQWKIQNMWQVNTGLSWTVLKGKGNINFRVNDIFRGMKFAFNTENPYTQNGQFNWESQTTYLGFNYRFGSGKNKAKKRRRRDDNIKNDTGGF